MWQLRLKRVGMMLTAAVVAGFLLLGCSAETGHKPAAASSSSTVSVVTTFTILADLTREIGGERVTVHSLVGENQDAHVYQPSPQDIQTLGQAKVLVANGLGFEGWLARVKSASGFAGLEVVAAQGVNAIVRPQHGTAVHQHEHDHASPQDPHAWHDIEAVRSVYIPQIVQGLTAADPQGAAYYQKRAADYSAKLAALHQKWQAEFASLPAEKRKAVTSHDAFAYLARSYNIQLFAAQGVSTEAEPTAQNVAQLIAQINQQRIQAIFVENVSNPKLIEQISRETGRTVGGRLYSDALTAPDGGVGSYIQMMDTNLTQLLKAMR